MLLHFLFDEKQNNNNNNNNGRLYIFCLFVFCIPFFYYSPVSQSLPLSTSLLSSSMPSFMYRWLNIIFFLSLVCCLIIFFLSFFGRFVFFPLFSRRNPSIRKKQQPTDRQHQQQSNMCPLPRFIPPVVQVCLLCIDRVVCLQSKKNQWNEDYEAKRERDTNKTKNDTNCLTVNRSFRFSFHPPYLI